MRVALSRLALALGLFALAPLCAAKSYAVLLKNPFDVENHVHIVNSKGTFGINNPGYGAPLGEEIRTVHRYSPDQINADFSHALEGMATILAAGLPPLIHSYTALLELSQGPLGKIAFYSERGDVVLDKAGQGVLIDGYSDDPFTVDSQQIGRDFGPALASLNEIIQAGFRPLSYIALLEDPDGNVGKVIVADERGRVVIEESGQAVDMGAYLLDSHVFNVGEDGIKQDFGVALDSKPVLPTRYVLLFQSGSTRFSADSEEAVRNLLGDVKTRPAPDITINGHTDTVGRDALNDKLSRQRAEYVAGLIKAEGIESLAIDIEYHGKRNPAVKTPDNTPEPMNRRVEVTVR